MRFSLFFTEYIIYIFEIITYCYLLDFIFNICFFKATNKGNDYESEIKLVWPTNGGGTLDAKTHARLDSHQDFQIELDVNSPKLKIVNYHLVVANKPAKGGKALLITATEDGQPILSGK